MTEHCMSCGSKRLVRRMHLRSFFFTLWEPRLYIPGGLLGLGRSASELRADTCVDCGHIHM